MDIEFRPKLALLAIALMLTGLFAATSARADELYGRIRGVVTDASGAVMPDVVVKVINKATGLTRETKSNSEGVFELANLPPATYNLSATKTGFRTFQINEMKLLANQVYVSNVKMEVGAVTEEVTVLANAAQVEQSSMQLTATISDKTITDLPLNGRNWVALQQTLPGVVNAESRFVNNFSTNGSQAQQNSYLINGTDYNDLPLNTPLAAPSPDAIAEVRMVTNTINPEYGRNSGAIMNAISKSGTNSFHGSAFDFYRDTFLNTRNFFQKSPSIFHQNQFGGTVGGPIWKNRTFFFFSYQGTRNTQPQALPATGLPTVFTSGNLNGDFSSIASKFNGTVTTDSSGNLVIKNPRQSPFPMFGDASSSCPVSGGVQCPAGTFYGKNFDAAGNLVSNGLFSTGVIPTQNFSPFSLSLVQQFMPAPNFGGNQFSFQPIIPGKTGQYLGRFDQNITQTDTIWFYAFANSNVQTETLPFTGATVPGFGDQSTGDTKQFTVAWNHTFTPELLNEVRAGYTRLRFFTVIPQNPVQPKDVGFTNIFPQLSNGAGMPFVGITGYFNLGFSTNGPQPRKDQTYQLTDNLSWVRGKHSFKFGYEGRRFDVWNPFSARNNGSFTFNNSAFYGSGDPGVNFLLGVPTSYNQTAGGLIIARAYEHYMYIQDQWRVKNNLTLTIGTGYQIDTPLDSLSFNGKSIACFSPTQQTTQFAAPPPPGIPAPAGYTFPGDPGCSSSGGTHTAWGHVGPRLGFAYSPDWGAVSGGPGKMSIRGGFGIYYNRSEEELSLQNLGDPPFGLSSNGIGDFSSSANRLVPSFPDPWSDVAGKGSVTNKFPFVPPPSGAPVDFTEFLPLSYNTIAPDATVPFAMNYNLTVEREFPGQTILRLGYVGARAYNLIASYDRNPTTPAGVQACLADPNNFSNGGAGGCADSPGSQPLDFPNHFATPGDQIASVGTQFNKGYSNYNAFQLTLDKHLSHGLQLLTSYTWSHSIDTVSSFEDIAFLGSGGSDPYGRLQRDYGDSAFDTRHRWSLSFSYDIPSLSKIWPVIPSRLVEGWKLTGINVMQTGQPIQLRDSNELSLTCNDFTFYGCPDRPDVVSTPRGLDPRTATFNGLTHMFFDPASFTDNAVGTLGNARRGFFHGPGYWNADFSIQKDTKIIGGDNPMMLQLRLEAFNVFNHTNFGQPVADVASPSFGRISGLVRNGNSRLVQLGAKFIF